MGRPISVHDVRRAPCRNPRQIGGDAVRLRDRAARRRAFHREARSGHGAHRLQGARPGGGDPRSGRRRNARGDAVRSMPSAPAKSVPTSRSSPADDLIAGTRDRHSVAFGRAAIGTAGLGALPAGLARRFVELAPRSQPADAVVFDPARRKTDRELAHAREATRIAELGYKHLLDVARPGMSEDELAAELRWHSKSLGAEDNFVLLCAGPHNKAVAPSNGRRMQAGDTIVCEITPSYRGQLAQICRTIVLGEAPALLRSKYDLVVSSMQAGFAAAKPGATMADICRAMNVVLEAQGYGEFCHPPHIRRRGHGLGFGAIEPGDVALDNPTVLEPDMLFMIHPEPVSA